MLSLWANLWHKQEMDWEVTVRAPGLRIGRECASQGQLELQTEVSSGFFCLRLIWGQLHSLWLLSHGEIEILLLFLAETGRIQVCLILLYSFLEEKKNHGEGSDWPEGRSSVLNEMICWTAHQKLQSACGIVYPLNARTVFTSTL